MQPAAIVAFAVPLVIMALVGTWAVRVRRRHSSARRSPLARRVEGIALGSAADIDDAGVVPWENLLEALAVAPESHDGPGPGGAPWDEGWMGTMLGLRSRIADNTSVMEPHVHWGERAGRQVLVRVGPDEKLEGSTTMFSNRHLRAISVVRVAAPPFELRGEDGRLRVEGEAPGKVADLVGELSPSPEVWRDLVVVGGPEGIVATRPSFADVLNLWLYDLWLLERIAERLDATPLPTARIGPAWKIPYGLGRAPR